MRIPLIAVATFHKFLEINGWKKWDKKLPWEYERWNKKDEFIIGKKDEEFITYKCSRKDSAEFAELVKLWNLFLQGDNNEMEQRRS